MRILAKAEAVDGYGPKGSANEPCSGTGRLVPIRRHVRPPPRRLRSITLLLGGIGGIAMGSTAAARRTDSSFSTYLASTSPSNLQVIPAPSSGPNYSPAMTELLSHLPHVKHVEEASIIQSVFPLGRNGLAAISDAAIRDVTPLGSVDGFGFTQDRATVIAGRMADPSRPDEVVMTAAAARLLGVHVGSTMRLGLYTAAQMNNVAEPGIPTVTPYRSIDAHVVGLVVVNTGVIQDHNRSVSDLSPLHPGADP